MSLSAVAIIGAGNVGQALASRLLHADVPVIFGVRDPAAAAAELTGILEHAAVKGVAEAARDADVILLAVPASVAIAAARSAGNLTGKILIDCTNPLRWDGGPVWAPPPEGSTAAQLAAAFPGASVLKGFNQFGFEVMQEPTLESGAVDAFFAGDDADAKDRAIQLAERMGFRAHNAGPLRNAALLENLAMLWIHMASVGGRGREFAFRMEPLGHETV